MLLCVSERERGGRESKIERKVKRERQEKNVERERDRRREKCSKKNIEERGIDIEI